MDAGRIDVFFQQGVRTGFGRRAVQRCEGPHDAAIDLFWPRVVNVAAAQAGFHVADGDLAVIGGDCACHDRGSVTLHHNPVWLFCVQHLADTGQCPCRQFVERLPRRHQVKVVIWSNRSNIKHLVEHSAVLRGHADAAFEPAVCLQGLDQWKQLDRFGTGAENGENFGARGHICAL